MTVIIYDNIFAAAYNTYNREKYAIPLFSAKMVVLMSQVLFLFSIISVIRWVTGTDLSPIVRVEYVILFMLLLYIALSKYYSDDKVKAILRKYDAKSKDMKSLWGTAAVLSFIIPGLVIIISLSLKK